MEEHRIMLTSEELARACNADPEFQLAARRWQGALRFHVGDEMAGIGLRDGVARAYSKADADVPTVVFSGSPDVWEQILAPRPPRLLNDLLPSEMFGQIVRGGDELAYWQYYPAIARVIEVMREAADRVPNEGRGVPAVRRADRFDTPVGRYVHVDIDGTDYRIYFEEAGAGIPLLLQHTAGSHGVQYRHLFEMPEITADFRLIAYDLPFHGKSVPPTDVEWWKSEYRLTREFAMAVPLALIDALGLDRPAFMGCSVGGQLALDLACFHPDAFRAVISLEPALKLGGDLDSLIGFWHPAVSNETKARMMRGLTSPDAPEPLRRETMWAYSCGWPPSFIGDLYYYIDDHDLRDLAKTIDTSRCGVHMLSGEYDFSATVELGQEAHDAIAGSTFGAMPGIGHFPMSEDPERLKDYLLPILKEIKGG
jgi:pimeloyl-ACP methyl ester carboxylesterase